MIRNNRNERMQQRTDRVGPNETQMLGTVKPAPGDVIIDNYRLKVLNAQPTIAQLEFTLSTILGEAHRSGYRMVDRVPFSSSESILIFEKVDK